MGGWIRPGVASGGGGGRGGGGGPHTHALAGGTVETLYDDAPDDVSSGAANWGRTLDIPFPRALVAADDDRDLYVRIAGTQGGAVKRFNYRVPAAAFRVLPENDRTSGNAEPTDGYIVLWGADGRAVATIANLFGRVNVATRNRDADGNDILRILFSAGNNANVTITDITATVELVPRIDALRVSSGGAVQPSGLPEGGSYLVPGPLPDPLTADHLNIVYNIGGTLLKVIRDHHAGHSAAAPFAVLNSGDFRGFHINSDQVANPSDGDFYANSVYGDFEAYRAAGFLGGASGWYSHDPTAPGEVWDEINHGGETIVLSWVPGSLIRNLADLPRLASATGQVWMDRTNSRIIAVTSYTPAEASHTTYKTTIYAAGTAPAPAAAANNPSAVWWGVGQTERWPSNYPNTDSSEALRRMRFVGGEPDEAYDGGAALGDIFVAAANVNASIDSGAPAVTDAMVFTLPAGRYNLLFTISVPFTAGDQTFSYSLRRITAGDDDVVQGEGGGFAVGSTQGEDVRASGQVDIRDLVVDGTEQFYCVLGAVSTTGGGRSRHFMHVERLA